MLDHARALFVDLNNSARFPTLTIGYLVGSLREAGVTVEVLSPLALGVSGYQRDLADTHWNHVERRVFFSTHPLMAPLHNGMHRSWRRMRARPNRKILAQVGEALAGGGFDVIFVSAYLDHYPSVVEIGRLAARRGTPLVLGGPAFNFPGVAGKWLDVPGLAAIVAAEVDHVLPAMLDDLLAGRDLSRWPGIFLPDGTAGPAAAPLADLSSLPVPDFRDFPWHLYPQPIVPVMTGRGCGWGRCGFCSDVTSVNGRTFRSRPVARVLDELKEQYRRHSARDTFFVDIKLNSDLAMWHGLIDHYQRTLPGGQWVGMVHVQKRGDNGLSREELAAARAAGMIRGSFGLESGSQRLNDRMGKGTSVADMSRVLHDAHAVGISMRVTMMIGYPGETESDLRATAAFLRAHERILDRVRVSRFAAIPGTRFAQLYERAPRKFPEIGSVRWEGRYARGHYEYRAARERGYRRAKAEVLNAIHAINRRPLPQAANPFNGLL